MHGNLDDSDDEDDEDDEDLMIDVFFLVLLFFRNIKEKFWF